MIANDDFDGKITHFYNLLNAYRFWTKTLQTDHSFKGDEGLNLVKNWAI